MQAADSVCVEWLVSYALASFRLEQRVTVLSSPRRCAATSVLCTVAAGRLHGLIALPGWRGSRATVSQFGSKSSPRKLARGAASVLIDNRALDDRLVLVQLIGVEPYQNREPGGPLVMDGRATGSLAGAVVKGRSVFTP